MRGHDERPPTCSAVAARTRATPRRARSGADGRSPADNVAPIREPGTPRQGVRSIPPEQWLRRFAVAGALHGAERSGCSWKSSTTTCCSGGFVGLNMDDPVWHPTTFTKNRDRLLSGDVAAAFFDAVQAHRPGRGLLSDEHFTVDGTQLEAWASLKSFRCVDAAESDPPETRAIPRSTSTGSAAQ